LRASSRETWMLQGRAFPPGIQLRTSGLVRGELTGQPQGTPEVQHAVFPSSSRPGTPPTKPSNFGARPWRISGRLPFPKREPRPIKQRKEAAGLCGRRYHRLSDPQPIAVSLVHIVAAAVAAAAALFSTGGGEPLCLPAERWGRAPPCYFPGTRHGVLVSWPVRRCLYSTSSTFFFPPSSFVVFLRSCRSRCFRDF